MNLTRYEQEVVINFNAKEDMATVKELTVQRTESDSDRGNAEQFSKLIKGYAGIEELSASLLNTLIEKITISEPQDVDGERIQEVKIYYKFIGYINQEGRIC